MNFKIKILLFYCLGFIGSFAKAQIYVYDAAGRLTQAIYANEKAANYGYDTAANISAISASTTGNTNLPIVTILSLTPGKTLNSAVLSFNGTAVDKNQLIFVYYQLNNNPWQATTTANGWTNWNAITTLLPGTNVLTVYALDVAGNTGSNRMSINCVPLWTPLQFGANLALWLDASSAGSLTLNETNVCQWNDLSGQGNNVTNFNTSTQPIFQPNGLNNLPTVNFTESGMGLYGAKNFGVSGDAPRAMAAVMNGGTVYTGTESPYEAFGFCITPYGQVYFPDLYSQYLGEYDPSFAANNNVLFGQFNNGILSGYYTGNLFGSFGVSLNTVPAPIQLGTRFDGYSQPGELSEIVYVNTGLSTAQQQVLEGYLAWKWGLQTNLPSNHPYRNAAPVVYAGNPTVVITTPFSGANLTNLLVPVAGTAAGSNPVASVSFQANGGPWQPTTTVNGWTNWNAFVPLEPGANSVIVQAEDVAGNVASAQVSINYVQPIFWTPAQLGTNLQLWLDASSSNTLTLSGSNVSQWNDLSGQGNNVLNPDASTQPVYQPTGLNGLPTINFTADGMGLFGVGDFGVSGSVPRAMAAVMNGGVVGTGTPASYESFGFFITPGGNVYVPYTYNNDIYAYDPSFSVSNNVVFGQFNNGILSGYFNGSLFGSNSVLPDTVPLPIALGTRTDGATQPGELSEIVYVNTGLTTAQQQILEGYLAWKWGLQTNLPTSHAYRYAPPLAAGLTLTIKTGMASGKGVQLQMTGVPGDSYVLQCATNLVPPINWLPVVTNVAGTNGTWTFTNTSVSTPRTLFYRVTGP
jgi:hypothetical protein